MNKDLKPENKQISGKIQKHHIGSEISFTWDEDDSDD